MRLFFIYFILIFLNAIHLSAQDRTTHLHKTGGSSTSYIKAYIDSVTESMITDYYKEDYSTVILKANEILKPAKNNNFPNEVFEINSYLANSYHYLNDSVKSFEYARENIKLAEKLRTPKSIIGAQIDLGNIYFAFKAYDKAFNAFNKAIPLAEQQDNKRTLFILNYNIAETILIQLKDHKRAKPYIEAAEKNIPKSFKIGFAGLNLFKANYAFMDKDYNLALKLYIETIDLAKETNFNETLKSAYEGYIKCLVKKGDYKKAYEICKITDSISHTEQQKDIEKSAKTLTANLNNAKLKEVLKNKILTDELIVEKAKYQQKFLVISIVISTLLLFFIINLLRVAKNRRKLNTQLEVKNLEYLEAKLESERLAKSKSRFLSTMSHELRTPLYGIIGLSTILNNDKSLESHKTELQSLKFSADYLLNLVNDVLTLNKMDSHEKKQIEFKSFHLKDFLNNIKESLEYITGQTNNNLIITLDPKVPIWIKGDQTKLSQVLINLLGNALKFTDHGEVQLIVSFIEIKDNRLKLKFEVKDNGQGISKDNQKKIFEEFGQLEHQSHFQGSGLGLTIVQKLLIDMNSDIQLVSILGQGSNFFFEITLGTATEAHINDDAQDTTTKDILRGKKVLVVDDNTINLLVTKKTLESHDIIVEVATNGQEGLDNSIASDYDLILMDVNMPVMDGIEATKRIRELKKNIIIIALTAVTQNEQDDRFKAAQFNDSIVKPYKINEFLKTLATNLMKANKA
ncbi:tetratricopeptide repeat-containing hybrid sensor histidine kinase/response regulator [Winogradskyella wichelsiae]|uniref:tetratricopeptide repeat-containing hybrid sensor histidine kinase/response regulator n=1 Tax=Winogradskyella wichelsiae TaxID=2697007 RepID=UPI0015CAD455|nr:response regulator [Winogradskyella wichelsiae]